MGEPAQGQGASGTARGRMARRGVLAGVAAVVAGALARASERVARATDGSPLVVGQNNTATATTQLTRSNANAPAAALYVTNNYGAGVEAHGGASGGYPGYGVYGVSSTDAGVYGQSAANVGVRGYSTNAFGGTGVYGEVDNSSGTGVAGVSLGYGVWGQTNAATLPPDNSGSIGVRGESNAGIGVQGRSFDNVGVQGMSLGNASTQAGVAGSSTGGPGVVGSSNNGVGVQGSSNGNVGVLGTSNGSVGVYANSLNQYGLYATSPNNYAAIGTSNNGTGVYGTSNGNVGVLGTSNSSIGGYFSSGTSTGLYATGPNSAFAARFDGPVQVNGAFTVLGGPKSAAVPHPDGSYRRLYCVESPESWFEDFGRDRLVNGQATVRLDRDFAALVRGDDYQVFPVPEGDCKGLYVTNRTPVSFEVREVQGGTSSLTFGYRVVARRKDVAGPRLERVDIPGAPQRPPAPQSPPLPPLSLPPIDPAAPPPDHRPPPH
ncbi:MAG TPA: hypothetical protein VK066_01515 [Chloroflexota bacterium]|nr:hypothetical protein [Chloroflexota bacterium]